MPVRYQGGKAVPAGQKAGRDKALHALMDELGKARDRVQAASQKLPNYDMPSEAWNQHIGNMQKFHDAIREVYSYAATMLHLK